MLKIMRRVLRKLGLVSWFHHTVNKIYPTFESAHPENLMALTWVFRNLSVRGSYYEFGVYKGFSLWFAQQLASALRYEMSFYGFDSFNGLPEPKGVDRDESMAGDTLAKGNFCAGKAFVQTELKNHGADMERITLVEGYYSETLKEPGLVDGHSVPSASVVLIDCDTYEASKEVLRFITPLLQHGTIIILDDYYLMSEDKGQAKAFNEWMAENPTLKVEFYSEHKLGAWPVITYKVQ